MDSPASSAVCLRAGTGTMLSVLGGLGDRQAGYLIPSPPSRVCSLLHPNFRVQNKGSLRGLPDPHTLHAFPRLRARLSGEAPLGSDHPDPADVTQRHTEDTALPTTHRPSENTAAAVVTKPSHENPHS